ncbi:hypothetical protein MCOR25_003364 [Pyricularia grisea]|nr:hypothetical protein MCOR25_003364 [Pyricularia grisea]
MRKQFSFQELTNVGRVSEHRNINRLLMEHNYDSDGNLIAWPLKTQIQRRNEFPIPPSTGGKSPDSTSVQPSDIQAAFAGYSDDDDDYSESSYSEGQGHTRAHRMRFPPHKLPRSKIYVPGGSSRHAIHVDPLSSEDRIINMCLSVSDDLEHELEEFSKLRRLGRFTDAFQLFDQRAGHFLHNRYIRVQYGQCLLEAGELGRLAQLAKEWEPKRYSSSIDALDVIWMFLAWEVEAVTTQLSETKSFLEAGLCMIRKHWPGLDSTEMALLGCLCKRNAIYPSGFLASDDWIDLCEHLVEEGMIWEFRDFAQWLIETHDDGDLVEHMCQRWLADDGRPENQDDSTLLAVLDILAKLSLTKMKKKKGDTKAETCFQLAQQFSLELIARDETYAKSQPYLRWIMANVIKEDPEGSHSRDKITINDTDTAGFLAISNAVFPSYFPPIFAPAEDEMAEWAPKSRGATWGLTETVRTVLRAAENLGDQRFRAGCLIELMYRGAESPGAVSDALIDHWTVTGNATEKKRMHLFRYMLANTDSARERLRLDILADGPFHESPALQLKQYRTLRALSSSVNDKSRYARLIEFELDSYDAWEEMLGSLSIAFPGDDNPETVHEIQAFSREPSHDQGDDVVARHQGGNRQQQLQLDTNKDAGRAASSVTRDYEEDVSTIQVLRKNLREEANFMRLARENLQLQKERMTLALRQSEVPKPEGGAANETTALTVPNHNHPGQETLLLTEPSMTGRERVGTGTPASYITTKKSEALCHGPEVDESFAHIGSGEGDDGKIRDHGSMSTAESEQSQAEVREKQKSQKSASHQVEVQSVSDLEDDTMGSRDVNDGKLIKEMDLLRKDNASLIETLKLRDATLKSTEESLSAAKAQNLRYREERNAALTAMEGKLGGGASDPLEDFIKQNERAKEENARVGQPSFLQSRRPAEYSANIADSSSANERRREYAPLS